MIWDGTVYSHSMPSWSEHRNPVKRGLAETPEQWPWSSFRHYATGQIGVVEVESQWTALRRGNRLPVPPRYAGKDG